MKIKAFLLAAAVSMLTGAFAQAQTLYKVGSTPTGVPFTFLNPKTNTIQGMMVDLVQAIGNEAGFSVEIQAMPFSTLVPALSSGKIDIISAAMSATPERARVVDFSADIYSYGEGVVVPATNTKDYVSFDDMKGMKVGGQLGTNYLNVLKASSAFEQVSAYDALQDVMRDVANGRLDAGFGDYPILAYNLSQGNYPQLRLVKTYKPAVVGPVNIAVRKGNTELLDKINKGLAALKTDGRLDAILKKWGLQH